MLVGMNTATQLKEKSVSLSIPFANLLRGYLLEEILCTIFESVYKEKFWLVSEQLIGISNYASNKEETLSFYLVEKEKRISFHKAFAEQLLQELFLNKQRGEVVWNGSVDERNDGFLWNLTGIAYDMQVPISVRIVPLLGAAYRPQVKDFSPFMEEKRKLSIYTYSFENHVGAYFFEIMKKLELISDMEAYAGINRILKTQSISGRHVMEEMSTRIAKEPRILRQQRIAQVENYRNYAYMRKRWEQFQKRSNEQAESWTDVIERFVCFAKPIWTALCENEIFFDDWMPELGRFI